MKTEWLESDWVDPNPERPPGEPGALKFIRMGFGSLGRVMPRTSARIAFALFTRPRVRARHNASDALLSAARQVVFSYRAHQLKGYVWGDAGPVVLLIHGWESRGTALRSFVPALLEKGFQVVAFDGPAHGESTGKRTNLFHFAGAIQSVMQQTGEVYGVIAHSFGGASVAALMGHLQPDLRLERLVLIASPTSIERVTFKAAETLGLPEPGRKRFLKMVESKAGTPLGNLDLANLLHRANAGRILLVYDAADPVVPLASAQRLAEKVPGIQLLVSKGYGHYRLMKNPDLINRIAGFMQGGDK